MRARIGVLVPLFAVSLRVDGQSLPDFIDDAGNVSLFEHDGSANDASDESPRARLARRFIETHGDFYDFIVIFTNFDFPLGSEDGAYFGVRNDVQGIGLSSFDKGVPFGSPRRLQGVVDMGPLSR